MTGLVALTGATGFIGRRLLDVLRADGTPVRALARRPQPVVDRVAWVAGDLADTAAVARLVEGASAVIHVAGAVRGATAADFDAVNVAGAATVGEAAARAGVARALLVSSLAAREPALSFYAASKRRGEGVMRAAFPATTVLRPPAVYGPGDVELMPLLDGMRRGFGVHPGHRGRFSLIHVDDLVAAIRGWLAVPQTDGDAYEIDDGTEAGYDWAAVLATVARVSGRRVLDMPVPRVVLGVVAALNAGAARLLGYAPMLTPGKVRELYHEDWVCHDRRFAREIGFRARLPLEAGLRETFSPAC